MAATTILVDDLSGDTIEDGKGGTYLFGLLNDEDEFVKYEIDLSEKNAKRLREALAEFTAKARPLTTRTRNRDSNATEVRAWAKANNIEVSDRGRIPAEVMDAYDKANKDKAPAK